MIAQHCQKREEVVYHVVKGSDTVHGKQMLNKDPLSLTVMHRGCFVVTGTQKVAIRVSSFSSGEICFHLNSLFML